MFTNIVPDHLASDLIVATAFGLLLVMLIAVGLRVIDRLWKVLDLQDQVQKGNISAGIVMGSTILGLAIGVAIIIKSIAGG